MRIRYHHPIPNFYNVENPINPMDTVSDDFLYELNDFVLNQGFIGISYSKLSDEFKKEWDIDWDNILILKYAMSEDILKMEDSREKTILEDKEFQEVGKKTFEIADFLSEKDDYDVSIIKKEREISLIIGSNDYSITLTKHRPPKK